MMGRGGCHTPNTIHVLQINTSVAGNDIVDPMVHSKPRLCARLGLIKYYTFNPPYLIC